MYRLHYISADRPGANAPWSVYVEEYATADAPEPIDGSQRWVSSHPTEDAAYAESLRLQSTANEPHPMLPGFEAGAA